MSRILHRVLRMDDVAWDRTVKRIHVNGEVCNICHREYSAFLSFKTASDGKGVGSRVKFINLPCKHFDPDGSWELAPDVLARLLLVAEEIEP